MAAGSRLETRLLGCGRAGQSVVVVGAGPGVLLRVFVRPRACFRAFAYKSVLTGLTHPRTARTLVALTWHPLELAQSVWPQRPAGSR